MTFCPNCKQPWQDARSNTCTYCGYTLPQPTSPAQQPVRAPLAGQAGMPQAARPMPATGGYAGPSSPQGVGAPVAAPVNYAPQAQQWPAPGQAAPAPYQQPAATSPAYSSAPPSPASAASIGALYSAPPAPGQMQPPLSAPAGAARPPEPGTFTPVFSIDLQNNPPAPAQNPQWNVQQGAAPQPAPSPLFSEAPAQPQPAPGSMFGEAPAQPQPVPGSMFGEAPAQPQPAPGSMFGEAPAQPQPTQSPPAGSMFEQPGAPQVTGQWTGAFQNNAAPAPQQPAGAQPMSLFGGEEPAQGGGFVQRYTPPSSAGPSQNLFTGTQSGPGSLFSDDFGAEPPQQGQSFGQHQATPRQAPRSEAQKAAQLQNLLQDEDEYYEDDYEPAPRRQGVTVANRPKSQPEKRGRQEQDYDERPRKKKQYEEDDYQDEDEYYDDEYYDDEPRGGKKGSKGRGVLIALVIVVLVAILGVLLYFVLYIGGFIGGGSSLQNPSQSLPSSIQASQPAPSSTPQSVPEPTMPDPTAAPVEFATAAGVDAASTAISGFYAAYLQCLNNQNLDALQYATETCSTEVSARLKRPGNQQNLFEYKSAQLDAESVLYGESEGRPCIVINAKMLYTYKPRSDDAAAYEEANNYQTFELVYEDNQWKVNRFSIINQADFDAHRTASLA